MAESKSRTGLIIIIMMALVVLVAVVWYFFFKGSDCDPNHNGFNKKGKPDSKCLFEDPKKNNEAAPSGSSGWISDSTFPIKKGSWGPKVAALQKAIGANSDGKFGSKTEAALKAKTGKTEVSDQAEYDSIVITTTQQGGQNYDQLKVFLGSSAIPYSAGVYVNVEGQNQSYVFSFWPDGQFFFSLPKTQASIKQGTYSDGGKRMKIDGDFFAYTEGNVNSNMAKITKDYGK